MIDKLLLSSFQKIFVGNTTHYGQHKYKYTTEGKEQGSNETIKNKLLSSAVYKAHLEGKVGLGIVPINADSKTKFAVIDIDIYDRNLNVYVEAIDRSNFPLVPFRTKSGGLHIYMFFQTFVSPKAATDLVKKMASALSLDILTKQVKNETVEIFPKQLKLAEGASGNWINMPYFNYEEPKQYAMREGENLSLADALVLIKERTTTLTDAAEFLKELPFADGPPCIQSLYILNPLKMNSGRNDYLFAFGTYLKKKDSEFFEQQLIQINNELDDPLPMDEVENTILKSLRTKEYSYKCTQPPICDFCNKTECKSREFGVGRDGGYFSDIEFGQMQQIKLSEPYYEWEVKTQSQDIFYNLRFKNEDEIIKQDKFLQLCLRNLHHLPVKMKQSEWSNLVNVSLQDMKVVEVDADDDMSSMSVFKKLLSDFLVLRRMAANLEQVLISRVFLDEKTKCFLFRGDDLLEYLITQGFRDFTKTMVYTTLKDMGTTSVRKRVTANAPAIHLKSVPVEVVNAFTMTQHNFSSEIRVDQDKVEEDEF